MEAVIYLDQENGRLRAPVIKSRQRLQSAPGKLQLPYLSLAGRNDSTSGLNFKSTLTCMSFYRTGSENSPSCKEAWSLCSVCPQSFRNG